MIPSPTLRKVREGWGTRAVGISGEKSMALDLNQEREQALRLLNMLPEEKLVAVVHLLQVMSDPVARSLANAPVEDEPISEEEKRSLDAAKEWLKTHEPIPHEEVLAELGLTTEDFQRMGNTPIEPGRNGR